WSEAFLELRLTHASYGNRSDPLRRGQPRPWLVGFFSGRLHGNLDGRGVVMKRAGAIVVVLWGILLPPPAFAGPLPGPGLDLPVDVDGDGVSTYGDRFVFNHWLELGGNLGQALVEARVAGALLDLSEFFASDRAR